MDNLTPSQQAAALHGLATNPTVPLADRLGMALQALDWYETDREKTMPVVEAAVAFRKAAAEPEHRKFWRQPWAEMTAVVIAVDQMTGGTADA